MSIAVPSSPPTLGHDELAHLQSRWGVFLILGVLSIIVGLMAISSTFIATLLAVEVFGWLLLIAGITEVIHAIMVRHLRAFAIHLLAAALYSLVGLFMLEDPIQAAAVITLIMAASFIVGGVLRIIFSLSVQFHAWQWVALNGFVDLILGVMIWNRFPESSLWVIGLFVGIDLLFHGWSWVIMALSVRRFNPAPPPA